MTKAFRFLLASLLALTASATWAQDRVALVIGNAAYDQASVLRNPINDAEAMADRLAELGFEVSLVTDASSIAMRQALDGFKPKADAAEIAMVFFAGHGIEMSGENYLIPVDAAMKTEAEAQLEAVALDEVEAAVNGARGLSIIILDACRNNPFARSIIRRNGSRSTTRGLVPVDLSRPGAVIGFSASAGRVAADGNGRHSPYTQAFLEVLDQPGVEIGQVFRRVAKKVIDATGRTQVPMTESQLPVEEYFLFPGEAEAVAQGAIETPDLTPEPVHGILKVNLTECDRLAGYPFLPRVEGDVGREFGQVPPIEAVAACEAAIKAHPEESYFQLLLARALLKQDKKNPRIQKALLAAADQYPAFAADRLGLLSQHGLAGQPRDHKLAVRRYEQACTGESAMGCHSFGAALEGGIGRKKDREGALAAYGKGCDLGFANACNSLGRMHDLGKGRNFDPVNAIISYGKACDMGYGVSCMNLGSLHRGGVGTRKDDRKAIALYRKACDLTEVLACVWAGSIHETELNEPREAALLYFDALSRGIKYDAIKGQSFKTRDTRRAFQELLRETGFYDGEIDGLFGRGTRTAIGRLCKC